MPSFSFDIGDVERVGSRFLSDVRDEIQRALATEKAARKITQQQIAEKLGTSRAVINRQIMGLENIGIKRAAEILWAIGWQARFTAVRIPDGQNQYPREDRPKALEVKMQWNNAPPLPKPGELVETSSSR